MHVVGGDGHPEAVSFGTRAPRPPDRSEAVPVRTRAMFLGVLCSRSARDRSKDVVWSGLDAKGPLRSRELIDQRVGPPRPNIPGGPHPVGSLAGEAYSNQPRRRDQLGILPVSLRFGVVYFILSGPLAFPDSGILPFGLGPETFQNLAPEPDPWKT